MGNVQCEICEIVQLSQNKIKCNSIMASPGLIYMHIVTIRPVKNVSKTSDGYGSVS